MFERFTSESRAVVVQAQQQARRLGHGYVGCEHLLLAVLCIPSPAGNALRGLGLTPLSLEQVLIDLVGEPDDVLDRAALAAIGIDLDLVRHKAEAVFGASALAGCTRTSRWSRRGSSASRSPHPPLTPRARRCLENCLREALARRDRHIGVEHIALALACMPDGVVPQLLTAVGVSPAQIRAAVCDRYRRAG